MGNTCRCIHTPPVQGGFSPLHVTPGLGTKAKGWWQAAPSARVAPHRALSSAICNVTTFAQHSGPRTIPRQEPHKVCWRCFSSLSPITSLSETWGNIVDVLGWGAVPKVPFTWKPVTLRDATRDALWNENSVTDHSPSAQAGNASWMCFNACQY